MIETRVVRSATELEALRPGWNRLVEVSLNRSVFLTWEWISAWADSYLTDEPLLTIVVSENEVLRAIAPLWIDRRLSVNTLRFLGSGEVCSDYLDFIVDSEDAASWIQAIWSELTGRSRSEWHVLEYSGALTDSVIRTHTLRLFGEAARPFACRTTTVSACPYLALPATEDEFLAKLSSSRRYTLSYSRRQLSHEAPLRFETCHEESSIRAELQRLEELHTRNWRTRGQLGAFASERQRRFNLRVAQALCRAGRLHLCSLYAGPRYLGGFFGFLYGRTMSFYIMSVELSAQQRVNAGDVLLAQCMIESIRFGATEFDFLRGREAYKYRWTQTERTIVTSRFYNHDYRAQSQRALDAVYSTLHRVLSRLLTRARRSQHE